MRYFSAKADVLVSRYGAPNTYIGAVITVDKTGATKIEHDPNAIVVISDQEFSKYTREYLQLVREGSLIEKKPAEYKAWVKAEETRVEKEFKDAQAAASKRSS